MPLAERRDPPVGSAYVSRSTARSLTLVNCADVFVDDGIDVHDFCGQTDRQFTVGLHPSALLCSIIGCRVEEVDTM